MATLDVKGPLFTRFHYPGGETQVRLTEAGLQALIGAGTVNVVSKITSAQDLVETVLATESVFHHSDSEATINLVLPYLPYARADRRFVPGDCFGLRGFLGMLRSLPVYIKTLDVHSAAATDICPSLMSVSPDIFISRAVGEYAALYQADEITVLYPDEGARRRYASVQMPEGLKVHTLHCTKKRDPESGRLLGFSIPVGVATDRPAIIVDDICDGGGTFTGIASQIEMPLGLYVTHGIFSKGLVDLSKYFDKIYTTDSYPFAGSTWAARGQLVETFDCLEVLIK